MSNELETLLLEGSLTDEGLLRATESAPDFRILPDATVLKIGGQTIMKKKNSSVLHRWVLLTKWPKLDVCHQAGPASAITMPDARTTAKAASVRTPKT